MKVEIMIKCNKNCYSITPLIICLGDSSVYLNNVWDSN